MKFPSLEGFVQVYREAIRRGYIPRRPKVYTGGIPIMDGGILDLKYHRPTVKRVLVNEVIDAANTGDCVIEIGGGRGLVTAHLSDSVGEDGRVVSYEGGTEQVEILRETLEINECENVEVINAIVAEPVYVFGNEAEAVVSISDLPNCDMLVMDCEGAETHILKSMSIRPRNIVVEAHPEFDAPVSTVVELLTKSGYSVESVKKSEDKSASRRIISAHYNK